MSGVAASSSSTGDEETEKGGGCKGELRIFELGVGGGARWRRTLFLSWS